MNNEISTRILGKVRGIHTIVHIPRSKIFRTSAVLTGGCLCLTFLWIFSPCAFESADRQLHQPWAKLFLFDKLVTLTLLYGVETWERSLHKVNNWRDLERHLVLIVCTIRSKVLVAMMYNSHMGSTPIIIEALFRSMTNVERLWELPNECNQVWHLFH